MLTHHDTPVTHRFQGTHPLERPTLLSVQIDDDLGIGEQLQLLPSGEEVGTRPIHGLMRRHSEQHRCLIDRANVARDVPRSPGVDRAQEDDVMRSFGVGPTPDVPFRAVAEMEPFRRQTELVEREGRVVVDVHPRCHLAGGVDGLLERGCAGMFDADGNGACQLVARRLVGRRGLQEEFVGLDDVDGLIARWERPLADRHLIHTSLRAEVPHLAGDHTEQFVHEGAPPGAETKWSVVTTFGNASGPTSSPAWSSASSSKPACRPARSRVVQ